MRERKNWIEESTFLYLIWQSAYTSMVIQQPDVANLRPYRDSYNIIQLPPILSSIASRSSLNPYSQQKVQVG